MSDIYRDPITHDISLGGTRQIRLTTGDEEILQRLHSRLSRWRGEWFHDTSLGLPYRTDVLVKNPDLSLIRSLLRSEMLSDAGVLSVLSIELDWDTSTRHLRVTFEVVATSGAVLAGEAELVPLSSDDDAVLVLDDDTPLVP